MTTRQARRLGLLNPEPRDQNERQEAAEALMELAGQNEPLPRQNLPERLSPQARRARQITQAVQAIQAAWATQAAFNIEAHRAIRAAVNRIRERRQAPGPGELVAEMRQAPDQIQVVPEQRQASPEPPNNALWMEEEGRIIEANLGENIDAGADQVNILEMANMVFEDDPEDIIDDQPEIEQEIINIPEENNDILDIQEVINVRDSPPPAHNNEYVGRPEEHRLPEGVWEYVRPAPGRHNNVHVEVQNRPVREERVHYVQNPYSDRHHRFFMMLSGVPAFYQMIYRVQHPQLEVTFRFHLQEMDGDEEQHEVFIFPPGDPPHQEDQEQ